MREQILSVWLCEETVGTLRLHSGSMLFNYENATRPLSLSMPVRPDPYKNRACEAFFGGLLPDSPDTKKLIARLHGINSSSSFNLLEKIGFDCAGAVSLCKSDEHLADQKSFKLNGTALTEKELYTHIKELPDRPLFVGIEGMRISLAGVQDKAAVCLIDDNICIPAPNVPSTHILKPPIRGLKYSVENEFVCMRLASRVGLSTSHVEIRRTGDVRYLLVKRYDRTYLSEKEIQRIHQEDFCQALGVVSTKKYQADGGPSLQDCFQLMNRVMYPARDKIELLKLVVFNYVVGNADCHAKNFSILHNDTNAIALAPAYDVLCTIVYSQTSSKFAMAIGGESDVDGIRAQNWRRFCELANVPPPAFKRISLDLIQRIEAELPAVRSEVVDLHCENEVVDKILSIVEERVENLSRTLSRL